MARRRGIRRAEYKALLTEAYDLDKPEAPGEALAYYMRHIRACGEPVLEAMCGSGRFLAPLLEAGIDVDGVDASADMLAACAARCEERRIRARTYRQFLHELGLPRRYRLIFSGERVMTERNDWVSRLWMREEFAARLGEAGFADVRATKAFSDTPLDGSERMVSFVARRPA